MGENAKPRPKPTLQVPPRVSTDFLSALGFSPGPMTLVSNMFPEQGQLSFSQLLAGAMTSPIAAANPGISSAHDLGKVSTNENSSDLGKSDGNKSNRPANLVLPPPAESLSPLLLNSPGFLSPLQSPFGMSHRQALAHVTAQAVYSQSLTAKPAEVEQTLANQSSSAPGGTSTANPPLSSPEPDISKTEPSEPFQPDKPAGDGYNWRKYGQKQVKGSECPRSYYKCTHLNCPVKKKVEHSLDGRISEITYRGQHNHDPPQPNKRVKDSGTADSQEKTSLPPQRPAPSSTNVVPMPASNVQLVQYTNQVPNHNVVNDTAAVVVSEKDEGEDEPIAKRRNVNIGTSVPGLAHQTVTDSKIVLQTRSEVDLLDDGYRWRKYGQKVVKGNPYPRSYYKCTYTGCNVRKHVERASSDPKAVITTYEGKHNHDVPGGRYTSQTQDKKKKKDSEIEIPMSLHLKEEQAVA